MRHQMLCRLYAVLFAGLLVFAFGASLLLSTVPSTAQPIFATNTPRPRDVLNVAPAAPIDQYALRLWTEDDLLDVLISQINRLSNGEAAQEQAISLTLYELGRRYPAAPTDRARRAALVGALLAAPRGTVDLRTVARPYIVDEINAAGLTAGTDTVAGFRVEVQPLNFDNTGPADALLRVMYPATAETFAATIYEDYIPVLGAEGGGFTLVPSSPSLPAGPYADVQAITLVRQGDLNLDGRDEFAIGLDTGAVNKELFIYGFRNGTFASLVEPSQRLAYGDIRTWPETDADLTVTALQLESPRWNCLSEEPVTWVWENNFYRSQIALNTEFQPVSSVGCRLLAIEPIYAEEPAELTPFITQLLDAPTLDSTGADRARMVLAMLYLLDGQQDRAEQQASLLTSVAGEDEWVNAHLNAFTVAAADPDTLPAEVCAALERAALQILENPDAAACDVDQLLARTFLDSPVPREGDLQANLEALGLPVLEIITVNQPGFAPREVVNFALTGSSWWAFAPTNPEFYVPTITDPPIAFEEATFALGPVPPPASVYDTLIEGDNPSAALAILENAALQNPDAPLSIEAQYIQALIYDLLGDRTRAKDAYFSVWSSGASTWASLAGVHLELRG